MQAVEVARLLPCGMQREICWPTPRRCRNLLVFRIGGPSLGARRGVGSRIVAKTNTDIVGASNSYQASTFKKYGASHIAREYVLFIPRRIRLWCISRRNQECVHAEGCNFEHLKQVMTKKGLIRTVKRTSR